MSIASMRFHFVCPDRETAAKLFNFETPDAARHLWAYTTYDAASRACLLSLEAPFKGHEVFYVIAPDSTMDKPSRELAERFFPDVPIRGDLSGNASFFSSAKAERLLGWKHTLG
jgi:hypothetical protein